MCLCMIAQQSCRLMATIGLRLETEEPNRIGQVYLDNAPLINEHDECQPTVCRPPMV